MLGMASSLVFFYIFAYSFMSGKLSVYFYCEMKQAFCHSCSSWVKQIIRLFMTCRKMSHSNQPVQVVLIFCDYNDPEW